MDGIILSIEEYKRTKFLQIWDEIKKFFPKDNRCFNAILILKDGFFRMDTVMGISNYLRIPMLPDLAGFSDKDCQLSSIGARELCYEFRLERKDGNYLIYRQM